MSTHGCGHSDDQGCLREVKLAMDGAEETIEASLARWEVLFKALPDLRADIAARIEPALNPSVRDDMAEALQRLRDAGDELEPVLQRRDISARLSRASAPRGTYSTQAPRRN